MRRRVTREAGDTKAKAGDTKSSDTKTKTNDAESTVAANSTEGNAR
ncbi:MAG: hypothetical protein M5U19_21270 [Microthrixaceae bacterium]|nr:hypothetical protein [Microthrixaceae bacterium]